jgi:hypothetical protein
MDDKAPYTIESTREVFRRRGLEKADQMSDDFLSQFAEALNELAEQGCNEETACFIAFDSYKTQLELQGPESVPRIYKKEAE